MRQDVRGEALGGGVFWSGNDGRRALLEDRTFDLLVVGGGVIGASVARDAAGRGLTVVLAEQHDFASGASRHSTKLIHGGIRYLPRLRLGLIRQGLGEQAVFRRTADYLYSDIEFVIPVFPGGGLVDLPSWVTAGPLATSALRVGLGIYDRLGRRRGHERHRRVSGEDLRSMFPTLMTDAPRGGFVYQDGQTDDARLTVSLLKTAVAQGAVALSRARVTGIAADGPEYRATLADAGEDNEVRARSVVCATWAYPDPLSSGSEESPARRLSKGVHLVYRMEDLPVGERALVMPQTDDGRLLFAVGWRGSVLVGTTDTPYDGDPGRARPAPEDIKYLRSHIGRHLDCGEAEPLAAFAGVRALKPSRQGHAAASRTHRLVERKPGAFVVVGGKLSSARFIAEEVVDRAVAHLGADVVSSTDREPLVGAGVTETLSTALGGRLARLGLPAGYRDRLLERYGTEATRVIRLLETDSALRQVAEPAAITLAEVVYTARCESVMTVGDFALRRTSLAWSDYDHGRSWAPAIAEVLGSELGWTPGQVEVAVSDYEAELVSYGL